MVKVDLVPTGTVSSAVPELVQAARAALWAWQRDLAASGARLHGARTVSLALLGWEALDLATQQATQVGVLERIAADFASADARRERVLAVAAAEAARGYREGAGNRTRYGKWWGADGQPWCGMWVSWAFAQAGTPLPSMQVPGRSGFAGTRLAWEWAVAHGRVVAAPKPGDIFFIAHSGRTGHTGIVVGVNPDGSVETVEGNTNSDGGREGHSVLRKTRRVASITAFYRPFGEVTRAERASTRWTPRVTRSRATTAQRGRATTARRRSKRR